MQIDAERLVCAILELLSGPLRWEKAKPLRDRAERLYDGCVKKSVASGRGRRKRLPHQNLDPAVRS